jgi:NAD-dependent DNA ligase
MTVKEQIEALRQEIEQHNYYYYVLSQPIISDYEYDMKMKQLQELEEKYPEYFDLFRPPSVLAAILQPVLSRLIIPIPCFRWEILIQKVK